MNDTRTVNRGFRLFIVIVVLGLIIDQAVKVWIRQTLPIGGSLEGKPWPGVFEITHTENLGIAFGMMQGLGAYLTPIAIVIAVAATAYSYRSPEDGAYSHLTMALLASGALGNMIDRLFLGKVTDMFRARFIDFPVFNVADTWITIAAVLLIAKWGAESLSGHRHEEPAAPTEPEAPYRSIDSDTDSSDKSSALT
ncbi:MAG: Lipoprotein signal peptidase [Fimbriimonadaceae bacterium]|nr:Lipoprotein signal peptidase [Fimbriimonadaceae bacterium]